MSASPRSVLVAAWVLLATATAAPAHARADEPAAPDAAHRLHDATLKPVPDCPHCRRSDAAPPAAPGGGDTAEPRGESRIAAAPARRDPSVLPAQASSTPLPVPSPASSIPLPGAAPTGPPPRLPELPDDLKFPPEFSTRPARPAEPDAMVADAGALDRSMPEPVFLPRDQELESLLTTPPIFTTGPQDPLSPFEPSAQTPPFVNPLPQSARGLGAEGAGPSARIVTATAQGDQLAMPPPPAGPLDHGADDAWPAPDRQSTHTHLNGFSYLPVMLGDQSPPSRFLTPAPMRQTTVPGQPPTPPSPFARRSRFAAVVPWARGFKIADNQSPMPQDRVFYTFNAFYNMNGDVNRRLGSAITDMQVYRQLLGIEKTFWRGNASVGLRLPIDTLWTESGNPALRGNATSVGNLSVFTKFLLFADPVSGNVLSGGLAVTAPTGPSSFAGSNASVGLRSTQLQPYLGYIFRRGDLYLQGFSAIDVPTDSRDVTMWYNDLALGYFVYRSDDPSDFLSAVVPTFEAHLNNPLNHRGALRADDPAGTPDVLDLTFGTSFILRKRLVATLGLAFPVTGPRPFDVEALALLNFYYGRYGMAQPWPSATPTPPVSQ